jgi:hypothetical protein
LATTAFPSTRVMMTTPMLSLRAVLFATSASEVYIRWTPNRWSRISLFRTTMPSERWV